MKFSLIDPLNRSNNVGGKKTETLKIQSMFKNIYYSMHLSQLQKEGQKLFPYLDQFSLLLKSNEWRAEYFFLSDLWSDLSITIICILVVWITINLIS